MFLWCMIWTKNLIMNPAASAWVYSVDMQVEYFGGANSWFTAAMARLRVLTVNSLGKEWTIIVTVCYYRYYVWVIRSTGTKCALPLKSINREYLCIIRSNGTIFTMPLKIINREYVWVIRSTGTMFAMPLKLINKENYGLSNTGTMFAMPLKLINKEKLWVIKHWYNVCNASQINKENLWVIKHWYHVCNASRDQTGDNTDSTSVKVKKYVLPAN